MNKQILQSSINSQFPIVQLKNLPFSHSSSELYDLMGQFGNIQEIRVGNNNDTETRGQALVVFTTFKAASLAVEKLSGFNYYGRYLVVKLFTPNQALVQQVANEIQLSSNKQGL